MVRSRGRAERLPMICLAFSYLLNLMHVLNPMGSGEPRGDVGDASSPTSQFQQCF